MKNILVIHRYYKYRGGEDVFLDEILTPTLKNMPQVSIEVLTFKPLSSALEIFFMFIGLEKLRPSYFKIKHLLKHKKFDFVFLNNFIPTLSLEIPKLCHKSGSKVFAWVHNSRLICANGLSFDGNTDCDDCLLKSSLLAFRKNCQKNILKSLLYAVIYRKRRVLKYLNNVHFLPISEFASSFIDKALSQEKLKNNLFTVIYPPVSKNSDFQPLSNEICDFIKNYKNHFYLYAGRLSFEKGVDRILTLANNLPHKAFIISGDGPLKKALISKAPSNVYFTNSTRLQIQGLYKYAEAIIIPSRVKETFSLVIAESQPFNTPIIYPEGGGAEEIVKRLNRSGIAFSKFNGQEILKINSPKIEDTNFNKTLEDLLSLN